MLSGCLNEFAGLLFAVVTQCVHHSFSFCVMLVHLHFLSLMMIPDLAALPPLLGLWPAFVATAKNT